jgi:hypothetical protein
MRASEQISPFGLWCACLLISSSSLVFVVCMCVYVCVCSVWRAYALTKLPIRCYHLLCFYRAWNLAGSPAKLVPRSAGERFIEIMDDDILQRLFS